MAGIYINLPDELAAKAAEHGLMTSEGFERALRRELSVVTGLGHARSDSDDSRYMEGFQLGADWMKDASFDEISEVAQWRGEAWRQFSLNPATHSLPSAICRSQGLEPPQGASFWVERSPFVEGVLEAVAQMWRTATG